MPIPLDEFDTNPEKTDKEVLTFLAAHPKLAYEAKEVAQSLSSGKKMIRDSFFSNVAVALDRLAEDDLVDARTVGGTKYYSFHQTE